MNDKYLYLLILAVSIAVPLLRSFESRVAYYKSFTALFPAIFIFSGIFILWDIAFTALGYWGFNPKYLSGGYLFGLPLGEWLFFVVVPYCSIFIYRVYRYFVPRDVLGRGVQHVHNFLIGFSVGLAITFYDRWYTVLTFGLLALMVSYHKYRQTPWMGHFYMSYLIVLIPYFAVNGVLTGSFIQGEIVWYNPEEMIGTRIGTIPFEDAFYGMALLMGICGLYEYFGRKMGQSWVYETTTE